MTLLLHRALTGQYQPSEPEKPIVQDILYLLAQGHGFPTPSDEMPAEVFHFPSDNRLRGEPWAPRSYESRDHKKPNKLGNSLTTQLLGLKHTVYQQWVPKVSIHMFQLQQLIDMRNGALVQVVEVMLEYGGNQAMTAFVNANIALIVQRFPILQDAFSQDYAKRLLDKTCKRYGTKIDRAIRHEEQKEEEATSLALSGQVVTAAQPETSVHLQLEVKETDGATLVALDGFSHATLAIRSIPYHESPEACARSEVRRLAVNKKGDGHHDADYIHDVSKRLKMWQILLPSKTWLSLASELRDLLPSVALQLTTPHLVDKMLEFANVVVWSVIRDVLKLARAEDLQLFRDKISMRPTLLRSVTTNSHNKLIDAPNELHYIYDVGEDAEKRDARNRGLSTAMIAEILEAVCKASYATDGVSARSPLQLGDNTAMLFAGAANAKPHINDDLGSHEAWPSLPSDFARRLSLSDRVQLLHNDRGFGPDMAPRNDLVPVATSQPTPPPNQQLIVQAPPPPPSDSILEKRLLQIEAAHKALEQAQQRLSREQRVEHDLNRAEHAQSAELVRKQFENVASPSMKHADNTDYRWNKGESSTSRVHFTDCDPLEKATDAEEAQGVNFADATLMESSPSQQAKERMRQQVGRKNLGVPPRRPGAPPNRSDGYSPMAGRGRFQPAQPQVAALRYDKKPFTEWSDMDEAMQQHLGLLLQILNETDWKQKREALCRLCRVADHQLGKCLKCWGATEKGRAFLGAEKAAARVRDVQEQADRKRGKPPDQTPRILFQQFHTDPEGFVQDGLDRVMLSGPQMDHVCSVCVDDEDMHTDDELGVFTLEAIKHVVHEAMYVGSKAFDNAARIAAAAKGE